MPLKTSIFHSSIQNDYNYLPYMINKKMNERRQGQPLILFTIEKIIVAKEGENTNEERVRQKKKKNLEKKNNIR